MDALPKLTVEAWYPHIQAVLRGWRNNKPLGSEEEPVAKLQLVRERLAGIQDINPLVQRLMVNEALMTPIKMLEEQDQLFGEIIRRRYLDNETIKAVALALDMGKDVFMRQQRKAIEALTALVLQAEQAARERRARQLDTELVPRTYNQLYGVEEALAELAGMVLKHDNWPVLALVGMGGIGKTALADAVTRQIIRQFYFEQVLWIRVGGGTDSAPAGLTADTLMARLAQKLVPNLSAETPTPQRDEQVHVILKALPHLVVIDNLESSEDSDHWTCLLRELSTPSKFLLTSRTHLADPGGVYHYPLRELSLQDSARLVRDCAARSGTHNGLAQISEEQMEAIYEVVGGNPLALKLVVSLGTARPLNSILADLRAAYTPKTEALYEGIFQHAWDALTPDAQALLEIMPRGGYNGMEPEQMQALSGLDEAAFWPAVDELVRRSLLEVWSHGNQLRYAVHRLTERFLDNLE